jgi:hypothetical protein
MEKQRGMACGLWETVTVVILVELDGWMDGWMDGWIDRQIDRQTDRQVGG